MKVDVIDVEWWPVETAHALEFDPAVWAPHQIARRNRKAEKYHQKCQLRAIKKFFVGSLMFFLATLGVAGWLS